MDNKNDKKQRKYWNEHLTDMYLDEEGEYSYRGNYYSVKGDGKGINRRALALALAIDALLILSGLFPATGAMETWYVIIPYALTIIFAGFTTYYVGRWTYRGPEKLREYIYKKTITRLPGAALGIAIASGITALAEIAHLFANGMGEYPKGAIILTICVLATSFLGYNLWKFINNQEWLNLAETKE